MKPLEEKDGKVRLELNGQPTSVWVDKDDLELTGLLVEDKGLPACQPIIDQLISGGYVRSIASLIVLNAIALNKAGQEKAA